MTKISTPAYLWPLTRLNTHSASICSGSALASHERAAPEHGLGFRSERAQRGRVVEVYALEHVSGL